MSQLHVLFAERYAHDGDTPEESEYQPAQSAEKSAENKP